MKFFDVFIKRLCWVFWVQPLEFNKSCSILLRIKKFFSLGKVIWIVSLKYHLVQGKKQKFKKLLLASWFFRVLPMDDGGVDRTVLDCWQHQLGQMADFPPLLFILVFDL